MSEELLWAILDQIARLLIFVHRIYCMTDSYYDKDTNGIIRDGFILIFFAMVFWSHTGTILFPAK